MVIKLTTPPQAQALLISTNPPTTINKKARLRGLFYARKLAPNKIGTFLHQDMERLVLNETNATTHLPLNWLLLSTLKKGELTYKQAQTQARYRIQGR